MPETLCLIVDMPDRTRWAIPASVIADNRARYYAERDKNTTYESEYTFAMADPFELKDWAANNMNWSDVEPLARLYDTPGSMAEDYESAWLSAHREVKAVELLDLPAPPTTPAPQATQSAPTYTRHFTEQCRRCRGIACLLEPDADGVGPAFVLCVVCGAVEQRGVGFITPTVRGKLELADREGHGYTTEQLIYLLFQTMQDVAARSSFEGNIQYRLRDVVDGVDVWNVQAAVRVGNDMGQGGMVLVQEWVEEPPPEPVDDVDRASRELDAAYQDLAGHTAYVSVDVARWHATNGDPEQAWFVGEHRAAIERYLAAEARYLELTADARPVNEAGMEG